MKRPMSLLLLLLVVVVVVVSDLMKNTSPNHYEKMSHSLDQLNLPELSRQKFLMGASQSLQLLLQQIVDLAFLRPSFQYPVLRMQPILMLLIHRRQKQNCGCDCGRAVHEETAKDHDADDGAFAMNVVDGEDNEDAAIDGGKIGGVEGHAQLQPDNNYCYCSLTVMKDVLSV